MARQKLTEFARYLQQIAASQTGNGLTDIELVERYVRYRDEAAFELLLWRHGTLVFNVCRRILLREEDAEDAFQATFLTFVRKAHAISRRGSVASWLYKVAYRIALEARARRQKIAGRERSGGEALAVQQPSDPTWEELRPILDEELTRLPERLRRPFILCYLEGKTNEEAAQEIGCPAGTVFSRLSRGREMLRNRLVRRGVTLSAATLTAALSERTAEAVPASMMVKTTLRAALCFADCGAVGDSISTKAADLAEGVLRNMFITKIKMAVLVLVVGAVAGGVWTHRLAALPPPEAAENPAAKREAPPKTESKPIAVKVVKPKPGGLPQTAIGAAEVVADRQQQVVPLVAGTIKEVAVDIGDRVKKGQVMVVLDAPLIAKDWEQATSAFERAQAEEQEVEAQVFTAEAEVAAAEALSKMRIAESEAATAMRSKWQSEVARIRREVNKGVVDPQVVMESKSQLSAEEAKVKATEAAVAAARADIKIKQGKLAHVKATAKAAGAAARAAHAVMDKARIQQSFTQLTAAFDGVVTKRTADPGNFVQPGDSRLLQPLLTVQRIDTVRVLVRIDGYYAPVVERGKPVELELSGLPGSEHKIARFSPTLDGGNRNRTMSVEIDVPNADHHLLPGMTGQVKFQVGWPDGLVVPSTCLVRTYDIPYLYVVRDGKAHLTRVVVRFEDGTSAEISQGIRASDLIIAEKQGELSEGTPVKVEKMP
jgi:RND family efflux transporter MFP subunit